MIGVTSFTTSRSIPDDDARRYFRRKSFRVLQDNAASTSASKLGCSSLRLTAGRLGTRAYPTRNNRFKAVLYCDGNSLNTIKRARQAAAQSEAAGSRRSTCSSWDISSGSSRCPSPAAQPIISARAVRKVGQTRRARMSSRDIQPVRPPPRSRLQMKNGTIAPTGPPSW